MQPPGSRSGGRAGARQAIAGCLPRKDLAWKNMEDFDEVAWLEQYLAGVKAKKDEALAHEKKLETLRKKAYGDAPPAY